MTKGANERVTLVGWSEGAGLGVLAAASGENKRTFNGLVTFGLEDVNVLGWCWKDNLTYITKSKPNEPTFRASDYMAKIAPLPYLMIQSSKDEFVSFDEAKRLATAAKEPKRVSVIQANNHRFDGNTDEFYRTLREGLQWMK
jgi:alpha/beta superfamily hydrolase